MQINAYVASNNGNSTPANSLSNPFPQGIAQPSGNSLGALTSIGNGFSYLAPNKAGGGTVYQYSADIQRQIGAGMALEVGYFGSRSNGLTPYPTGTGTLPINEINPSYLSLGQTALSASVANPFYGIPGAAGVIGNPTVTRAQLLLPFPEYSTITRKRGRGSCQVRFPGWKTAKEIQSRTYVPDQSSPGPGMKITNGAAETTMDLMVLGNAGTGGVQNIYNLGAEWALAAADTPMKCSASWTYDLPFGKGQPFAHDNTVLNYVIGGWAINGTAVISNGFPLYITQNNLNANIGGLYQRPNATGVSPAESGSLGQLINQYINPAAFSPAPADTFGNLSRNIPYLGPGIDNWDLSMFKTVTY